MFFMRCKNSYSIEQFSLRFYCIRDAILLHAFSDELCHKLNERFNTCCASMCLLSSCTRSLTCSQQIFQCVRDHIKSSIFAEVNNFKLFSLNVFSMSLLLSPSSSTKTISNSRQSLKKTFNCCIGLHAQCFTPKYLLI